MAFTYDWVSWVVSLGAWRCWVRASLKHVNAAPGATILELAHGTGNLQIDLNVAGYRTVGYDLSPYMGLIAQRKLAKRGLSPRLTRGKAQALPFPSEAFEAVVSTFPTEFIVAPQTLHEVYRVLKPGGTLVIVPNAMLTGGGWSAKAIERLYQLTGQREEATNKVYIGALFAPFQVTLVEGSLPAQCRDGDRRAKVERKGSGISIISCYNAPYMVGVAQLVRARACGA